MKSRSAEASKSNNHETGEATLSTKHSVFTKGTLFKVGLRQKYFYFWPCALEFIGSNNVFNISLGKNFNLWFFILSQLICYDTDI